MKKTFPFYKQPDSKDCGPTCLRIVAKHYGKLISLEKVREFSETTREGSSLLKLSDAAEAIGFKTIGIKVDYNKLKEAPLPLIVHWNKNHFAVVYKIKNNEVYVSDPAYGLIKYSIPEFIKHWIGNNADSNTKEGIALLLETTPNFKKKHWEETDKTSLKFLYQYFFKHKSLLVQLCIGLLTGSILQLIFPFLTQSIVDVGIQNQDINFIYIVLLAQIMLFFGRTSVEIFRSWILLHLSTRINISLVSDFFIKLMKLPISYFDTRMTGDIMQRINDHNRIENLLTGSTLNTLFSLVNLFVFGAVLIYYSPSIFLIFLVGSILYILWILYFLKRRKELDYKRFSELSDEQSTVIELVNGMQEIKMNNAEKQKRWKWEFVQARLFKVSIQSLALEQTQSVGSSVINELKNIIITFTSAVLVIEGSITLGMMLSIQYIIGQLNGPISQMVNFIRSFQDAKISMERLGEIHNKEDEETKEKQFIRNIKPNQDLEIQNVNFKYLGTDENVLKEISLHIPTNKITAIVGASGSGKTTLMKLLLKFYEPNSGIINYGENNLNSVSHSAWRDNCGVVMQEGYIFNDTIAYNIAIGEDIIDQEKLINATKVANIYDFIQSLPLGFNTKIGNEGIGVSTGQKQRLFIARAIYKNPNILFFDEATSALDAKNERIIMGNLSTFFKDRTVVVIAHRLSTVKNADQIVVVDEGKIQEKGTHKELLSKKEIYYGLVKNQLELEKISTTKDA
ncbi:ABC-type multidrug transport system, ATPase and permease components [Cellulophaga geojensis KL-A]|uniref:ABC-type multidrug transport system, ATPase and permease components n=1 Tax=Cellulophaga geojensis KL-A TaxID=1328323 RepID=A0ABN0RLN4_9FLAO|nr:peptidase domain-containing ABC transporter [Cellulophaga geojensis]EWH12768.1 ABC-type multidrug transport system, ATPase and permease components [Cellulophaga geojensis KL-A]